MVAIIDAYAPDRGVPIVAEFEQAIEQPYVAVDSRGNPTGANQHTKSNPYPDKDSSSRSDRQYGTSANYLMAQLIAKVGPDVVEQIGPGIEPSPKKGQGSQRPLSVC